MDRRTDKLHPKRISPLLYKGAGRFIFIKSEKDKNKRKESKF